MIFRFGDCELDEELYQLRRAGRAVPTEPKVFDVIAYLVRRRDRVVTRDELLAALWAGDHVSDSALSSCIRERQELRLAAIARGPVRQLERAAVPHGRERNGRPL